jgi:hypothetical protein
MSLKDYALKLAENSAMDISSDECAQCLTYEDATSSIAKRTKQERGRESCASRFTSERKPQGRQAGSQSAKSCAVETDPMFVK